MGLMTKLTRPCTLLVLVGVVKFLHIIMTLCNYDLISSISLAMQNPSSLAYICMLDQIYVNV